MKTIPVRVKDIIKAGLRVFEVESLYLSPMSSRMNPRIIEGEYLLNSDINTVVMLLWVDKKAKPTYADIDAEELWRDYLY